MKGLNVNQLVVEIEGGDAVTLTLRDHREGFLAWERRALYERYDAVSGGQGAKELHLMRAMAAHLLREWSIDLPRPEVEYKDGSITYRNLESYDLLPEEVDAALLQNAAPYVKKLSLNFSPSPDKASPTKPSDG